MKLKRNTSLVCRNSFTGSNYKPLQLERVPRVEKYDQIVTRIVQFTYVPKFILASVEIGNSSPRAPINYSALLIFSQCETFFGITCFWKFCSEYWLDTIEIDWLHKRITWIQFRNNFQFPTRIEKMFWIFTAHYLLFEISNFRSPRGLKYQQKTVLKKLTVRT